MSCALILMSTLAVSMAQAHIINTGNVVGRAKDVNVTDQDVIDAGKRAVVHYNAFSNDAFYCKFVRVTEAKKQVVAGVKYILTVELAPTPVSKSTLPEEDDDGALALDDREVDMSQAKLVHFTVLSQPWNSNPDLRWQVLTVPPEGESL